MTHYESHSTIKSGPYLPHGSTGQESETVLLVAREDDPSNIQVLRRIREPVVGHYRLRDGSDLPAVGVALRGQGAVRVTPFRPWNYHGPDTTQTLLTGVWERWTIRRIGPVGGPPLQGEELARCVTAAARKLARDGAA